MRYRTWENSSDLTTNAYNNVFNTTIKTKYNNVDAYATFNNHFSVPFYTTDFINSLYSKISRIFNANNSFVNFTFTSNNEKNEKDKKIESNLTWFKTKAWEAFKYAHNSIIIIDTDKDNNYRRDILNIKNVYHIESKDNIIGKIIFSYDKKTYYAFDEKELLVLQKEKNESFEQLQEVNKITNKIKRVPAVWLIDKNLNDTNEIVKESLISKSLAKVEELLIAEVNDVIVNEKIVPLTTLYKEKCTYDVATEYCQDGYLIGREKIESDEDSLETRDYLKRDSNGKPIPCPICNKILIPGQTLSIETPKDDSQKDVKKNLVDYITPDIEIFEKSDKRLINIRAELEANVCGIDKLNTNLNHNEETIKYTVESRETILNYWKSGFETLIKNVQDIYFKSKYSNYNSSTVNLGTDYYLKDLNDVIEEQGKAKENGLNEIIDYNTQYITAKYQNDPEQRKRSLIVKNLAEALRPFNSENKEDVIELFKANKINSKQFTIYSNFFNWINTFEKTKDIELIEMDYNKLLIEFEKEIQNYLIKYKSDEQTN